VTYAHTASTASSSLTDPSGGGGHPAEKGQRPPGRTCLVRIERGMRGGMLEIR
jgi:hypothetical protein